MRWIAATLLVAGCDSLAADKSHSCPATGAFSDSYLCPADLECAPEPIYCGPPDPNVTACDNHVEHQACVTVDGAEGSCLQANTTLNCTPCSTDLSWCQCTPTSNWCTYGGWNAMTSVASSKLISVWASSPQDAYAGGQDGKLFHYDGMKWAPASGFPTLASTSKVNGIWGTGPNDVFVVTSEPRITHFNGATWTDMTLPGGATAALTSISGTNASDVVAVGDMGEILSYNGSAWSLTNVTVMSAAPLLNSVWGSEFAVGGFGVVAQKTGSWSASQQFGAASLYGVWGSSNSDVYAVGLDGTNSFGLIAHYTASWSSGSALVTTDNLQTSALRGIWGTSANDIYVVGQSATIAHFNGSGWVRATPPGSGTSVSLFAVGGSGASDVYAVGQGGAIWHYSGPN